VWIDPHQTWSVGKGSDHLQLSKFWLSRAPGKGVCGGVQKICGFSLLQPAGSVCVSLEHFFSFFHYYQIVLLLGIRDHHSVPQLPAREKQISVMSRHSMLLMLLLRAWMDQLYNFHPILAQSDARSARITYIHQPPINYVSTAHSNSLRYGFQTSALCTLLRHGFNISEMQKPGFGFIFALPQWQSRGKS